MRELSSDLREFIHLLNTTRVRYMIVGAWALAFHARPRYTGDLDIFAQGHIALFGNCSNSGSANQCNLAVEQSQSYSAASHGVGRLCVSLSDANVSWATDG